MKKRQKELTEFEQQIADQIKAGKPLTGEDGIFTPMMKRILEAMLQAELSSHMETTAGPEKNRRNGQGKKNLKSSLGSFEISSPRDRDGSFEPVVVKKRQTTLSSDIDRKILSLFTHGMSYSDIRGHIADIYGIEVSDSVMNQVTDSVLPEIAQWKSRPLEPLYAVIWLDAIHYRIREDGMVKTKAVYCVLGLDMQGTKEVLGFYIGENEKASFWLQVLQDIQQRGVKDVLIACTDNLKGFVEAIGTIFPYTECQLCIIHQIRNTIKQVSNKQVKEIIADLKKVYQAPSKETAWMELSIVQQKWIKTYPRLTKSWYDNWENLSQYFKYPAEIRRIIYTTNTVEGFHRMLRKATKTKGAFTNENALSKIIYFTIQKAQDKWKNILKNWGLIYSQLSIYFENRITT
ncbi:MAG: IS256 family transposase [Chlamydiales bacterium]